MDRFNKLKELQRELNDTNTKYTNTTEENEKKKLKNHFLILKDKETEHLYSIISELTQEKLQLLEDIKMLNIETSKYYEELQKLKNKNTDNVDTNKKDTM